MRTRSRYETAEERRQRESKMAYALGLVRGRLFHEKSVKERERLEAIEIEIALCEEASWNSKLGAILDRDDQRRGPW